MTNSDPSELVLHVHELFRREPERLGFGDQSVERYLRERRRTQIATAPPETAGWGASSVADVSYTIAGVTRVMQRWSRGQVFFWHGPQNTGTDTFRSFGK